MKKNELKKIICLIIIIAASFAAAVIVTAFIDVPTVAADHLVIASSSETAVYSGDPLVNNKWYLLSGELDSGDYLEVKVFGSQTEVGASTNSLTAKVLDKNNRDVSDKYEIILCPGVLTIKPTEIVVTGASEQKVYDGKELTAHNIYYDASLLKEGEYVDSFVVVGSQTNVGESSNIVKSVTIKNKNEEDVTKNYIIITKEGTLSVTFP